MAAMGTAKGTAKEMAKEKKLSSSSWAQEQLDLLDQLGGGVREDKEQEVGKDKDTTGRRLSIDKRLTTRDSWEKVNKKKCCKG